MTLRREEDLKEINMSLSMQEWREMEKEAEEKLDTVEAPTMQIEDLFEECMLDAREAVVEAIGECSGCCLDNIADVSLFLTAVEIKLRKKFNVE